MSDYEPVNPNGNTPFTKTVGATAVTGGWLVTVSGDNLVVPSGVGDHSVGIAAHDAGVGQRVTVWPLTGIVHEISPEGVVAIAAGVPVIAGLVGLARTGTLATVAAAGTLLGICTKAGTGGTSKCQFIGS